MVTAGDNVAINTLGGAATSLDGATGGVIVTSASARALLRAIVVARTHVDATAGAGKGRGTRDEVKTSGSAFVTAARTMRQGAAAITAAVKAKAAGPTVKRGDVAGRQVNATQPSRKSTET